MATSGVSSTSSSSSSTGSSLASLSQNYDLFLTLLTTQLKNQSPLDPMDSNQFTEQLVQYSSVEQLIQINTNIATLTKSMEAANLASFVNYVGTTVTVDASTTTMKDGEATWNVNMASTGTADIVIKDSAGKIVYTTSKSMEKGDNTYTWDGTTANGTTYKEGAYTITVSGKTSSGTNIKASTDTTGVVTALDWSDGVAYLMVNGSRVTTDKVKAITASS